MKETIRTNDLILVSRIKSILNVAYIQYELDNTRAIIIEDRINNKENE